MLLSDWKTALPHFYTEIITVLVEKNLCFWVQSPRAQHWLSKELSTVPSFALQSTYLMVVFYLLTEKCISTMRHKTQVKRVAWFWEFQWQKESRHCGPWKVIKAIIGRTIACSHPSQICQLRAPDWNFPVSFYKC